MSFPSWSAVLLWTLYAATVLECAIGIRSYVVERREGMRVSRGRMIALVCIVAAALGVALYASRTPAPQEEIQRQVPQAPPSEPSRAERQKAEQDLAAAQSELEGLNAKKEILEKREGDLKDRIVNDQRILGQKPERFETRQVIQNQRERTVMGVAIMAVLVVFGVITLVLGGRIQTLFPEHWSLDGSTQAADREAQERKLEELATKVWNEQYKDGLSLAERIIEDKLPTFKNLDLKFLRGYCAVQLCSSTQAGETAESRTAMIRKAIADLEAVVESAPNRGDALYTLGVAFGIAGQSKEALPAFTRAQQVLETSEKLPYEHNISCILLKLGEESLSIGDTQAAEGCFARVSTLGTLSEFVAHSRLRIGIIEMRQALAKQQVSTASTILQKISSMSDLLEEQRQQMSVIGSALRARIALRQDEPEKALAEVQGFLRKSFPAGVPQAEEGVADETFSPILDADLNKIPREMFRGFLFIEAVALSCIETRPKHRLTEAQVIKLSQPLLRGLQLIPRERELLGALGGLYYWFRPEQREGARQWLESAAIMGSPSRIVHKILEHDRLVEVERREALDWFRSASFRFLRDPSIAADVKRALVEELGRFQEFAPMLISLRELPDLEPEPATIETLRDRARYLAELVATFSRRGNSERASRLAQINTEYNVSLADLERSSQNLNEIELRVYRELSDSLILS